MATDTKEFNINLASGEPESGGHQETQPYAPVQVPTVSEKVEGEEPAEGKRARVPRRILHFSDGTLEEYSTEEEEDEVDATEQALQQLRTTDTGSLGWLSWGWYWLRLAGYNALSNVDCAGERLAWMLGITSPKYQYELEEYYEMQRKEKEEKEQRDLEAAGWTPGSAQTNTPTNHSSVSQKSDQSPSTPASPCQSTPVTSQTVSGQPVSADTIP